eukprot:jgi/Botrbrau1/9272/Bobra.180_1s0029.1
MCISHLPKREQPQLTADVLGYSLRFPESDSPSTFWANLASGVDLQTSDARRWPVGLYNLPPRTGKAPGLDLFDNTFFQVHGKQAQRMDPQQRKLLETGYEAWMDSGVDFTSLRGSDRVGVYVGACGSDAYCTWLTDIPKLTGYEHTGCTPSMFANRLSWYFDFQGPSKVIDTACSSSLVALHDAVTDIVMGRTDYAMVGGTSAILNPAVSLLFNRLHVLSPEATCKSFDAEGNGYTRSDGISVLILRRTGFNGTPVWFAKPPVARILGIATNNDGYTKESITFPSTDAQKHLARQVCKQSGIHPSQIDYVEAHGTGTVAGDAQELASIDAVYGSGDAGRTAEAPLLIGSVKSNMGHCEGGSGLASILKVLLSIENNTLPANLHFHSPNPNSEGLINGTLKVVTESVPFPRGLAAINNFGVGGSNVHVLIQGNPQVLGLEDRTSVVPYPGSPGGNKVIPLAARTREGMLRLIDRLCEVEGGPQTLAGPLTSVSTTLLGRASTHPFRGTILPSGDITWSQCSGRSTTPVWFAFSGNGSQWAGMAESLLRESHTFRNTVESCGLFLKTNYGFDLLPQFTDKNGWREPVAASAGLAAVQIGLVDFLKEDYGILPNGVLGHSAGDYLAGYADGALTLQQTLSIAMERASAAVSSSTNGLMAAVGLSAVDAEAFLNKENCDMVVVACDNSPTNVTLSGPAQELRPLLNKLKADNIFVREVDTRGVAYHSPLLDGSIADLEAALKKLMPVPTKRSTKWISSVFPSGSVDSPEADSSATYQVILFSQPKQDQGLSPLLLKFLSQ